ncbi:hypothetical protein V8G54_004111 [Vigna mungo]|uniref:Uncharacterized protein n=1 Tax=Vigna mungo TaxID=3915 RepID=A0AAQ3PF92_VIGMU
MVRFFLCFLNFLHFLLLSNLNINKSTTVCCMILTAHCCVGVFFIRSIVFLFWQLFILTWLVLSVYKIQHYLNCSKCDTHEVRKCNIDVPQENTVCHPHNCTHCEKK